MSLATYCLTFSTNADIPNLSHKTLSQRFGISVTYGSSTVCTPTLPRGNELNCPLTQLRKLDDLVRLFKGLREVLDVGGGDFTAAADNEGTVGNPLLYSLGVH